MLRIGMIGAGWVTQHHLNAYQQLVERAKVVAIADPVAEARTQRAATYSIPATYATAAEMLEREKLDAVDIASPRETHVAMCELAAAKGLAILCQKPLAPTLCEAQALVQNLPPACGSWCMKIGVFVLITD
jgi:D-apiose dehydrogenase